MIKENPAIIFNDNSVMILIDYDDEGAHHWPLTSFFHDSGDNFITATSGKWAVPLSKFEMEILIDQLIKLKDSLA